MSTTTTTTTMTQPPTQLLKEEPPKKYHTPRNVTTTLAFNLPKGDGSLPADIDMRNPESTLRKTNAVSGITIHDARGHEEELTLDGAGFQYLSHVSKEKKFDDEERIKSAYYEECVEILKNLTGAKEVIIYHHALRYTPPVHKDKLLPENGPVQKVHIDCTPTSITTHLNRHAKHKIADVEAGERVRVINIWRPIKGPILRDPLAVMDARTVENEDLVKVRQIWDWGITETFAVKYDGGKKGGQKWWYLNEHQEGEILLIGCCDSKGWEAGKGRVPHCSFVDEERSGDAFATRESIEVRALVFG